MAQKDAFFTQAEMDMVLNKFAQDVGAKVKQKYEEFVATAAEREVFRDATQRLKSKLCEEEKNVKDAVKRAETAEKKLHDYQQNMQSQNANMRVSNIDDCLVNDRKFNKDVQKKVSEIKAGIMKEYGL